jgi:hypothetical protein
VRFNRAASNLGGFVARHFHADADFDDLRGSPSHRSLLFREVSMGAMQRKARAAIR